MNKTSKTNPKGKLALHSETLVRLDPAALDEVNGGIDTRRWPEITRTITVSVFTCAGK